MTVIKGPLIFYFIVSSFRWFSYCHAWWRPEWGWNLYCSRTFLVDCVWNVMADAQKPDFFCRRNGWVHLNRRGCQFSQMLTAEVCASAVVMLDTPRSEVVWRVLATHSIRQFPLHFPSRASPCAIRFQTHSTLVNQVKRLLVLICRRFAAVRHKFHCKRPFKKPLVRGKKELLQRSLSPKVFEQQREINSV